MELGTVQVELKPSRAPRAVQAKSEIHFLGAQQEPAPVVPRAAIDVVLRVPGDIRVLNLVGIQPVGPMTTVARGR